MRHDYDNCIPERERLDGARSIHAMAEDVRRSFDAAEKHRAQEKWLLNAAIVAVIVSMLLLVSVDHEIKPSGSIGHLSILRGAGRALDQCILADGIMKAERILARMIRVGRYRRTLDI